MRDLPTGTVTFLFTDIEESTQLLQELGADGYRDALESHRRLLRDVVARHGGYEVDTQGDAFFVAFKRAQDAVRAAVEAQRALAVHAWPEGREQAGVTDVAQPSEPPALRVPNPSPCARLPAMPYDDCHAPVALRHSCPIPSSD